MGKRNSRQIKTPVSPRFGRLPVVILLSVTLLGCETAPEAQPRHQSRGVIPRHIDSLLIIPQVTSKPGWFGPDYGPTLEAARSAFTRIALSKQYTVVAPREDFDRLFRERLIGQEQAIVDSEAIKVGKNAAASGVVILSISIVQGTRYPPQPAVEIHFGRGRSFGRSRPVKQPYAEVTVTARLLDVFHGTIVWEGEGNFAQMNPSNLNHVVTQAVFNLGF